MLHISQIENTNSSSSFRLCVTGHNSYSLHPQCRPWSVLTYCLNDCIPKFNHPEQFIHLSSQTFKNKTVHASLSITKLLKHGNTQLSIYLTLVLREFILKLLKYIYQFNIVQLANTNNFYDFPSLCDVYSFHFGKYLCRKKIVSNLDY